MHTEGPWWVVGDDECPENIPVIEIAHGALPSTEYKQICYVQPTETTDSGPQVPEFELSDEDRDNARLIAAAPDLLSIAKRCAVVCGSQHWDLNRQISSQRELAEDARAAIKKAEEG